MRLLEKLDNFGAATAARLALTLSNYEISGTVTNGGQPLPGVHMDAGGGSSQYFNNTTTDLNGNYTFSNVPNGIETVITPTLAGVTFTPATATVDINGASVTGTDFVGTGTPTVGFLTTSFAARDFEIGSNSNGLQEAADWINYYCNGGNASFAEVSLTERVGTVQLTAIISLAAIGAGWGFTNQEVKFKSFEILHNAAAATEITEWLTGLWPGNSVGFYPQLFFCDTYTHSGNVYLVLGVTMVSGSGVSPNYVIDIFSGELGAAEITNRLNQRYTESSGLYYYNYDYVVYQASFSTDTFSGTIIIGHE